MSNVWMVKGQELDWCTCVIVNGGDSRHILSHMWMNKKCIYTRPYKNITFLNHYFYLKNSAIFWFLQKIKTPKKDNN